MNLRKAHMYRTLVYRDGSVVSLPKVHPTKCTDSTEDALTARIPNVSLHYGPIFEDSDSFDMTIFLI